MYWNYSMISLYDLGVLININMRCIEMNFCRQREWRMNRLIETWDVLKYGVGCANLVDTGLIETWDVLKSEFAFPPLGGVFTINRNMRCIEIRYFSLHIHPVTRLIETWDVLKFSQPRTRHASVVGLIETWDVLKCKHIYQLSHLFSWLIETWDVLKSTTPWQKRTLNRLTETWDVLKFSCAL